MQMNPPDWMSDSDRAAYSLLLEVWREFMGRGSVGEGFPGKDHILQSEGAADSEQLYSRADYRLYQAVDGCIDSLLPIQKQAIYAVNGQSHPHVFRSQRFTLAQIVDMAERELLPKLKANSCTWVEFK